MTTPRLAALLAASLAAGCFRIPSGEEATPEGESSTTEGEAAPFDFSMTAQSVRSAVVTRGGVPLPGVGLALQGTPAGGDQPLFLARTVTDTLGQASLRLSVPQSMTSLELVVFDPLSGSNRYSGPAVDEWLSAGGTLPIDFAAR